MQCAKCRYDTSNLDVYGMVDLTERHPERERWQKNPEHRKTLEFYAWFISSFDRVRLLDVGAGPGTVAIPLSRLSSVVEVICVDRDPAAQETLREVKNREQLHKIRIVKEEHPWQLSFETDSFDVV